MPRKLQGDRLDELDREVDATLVALEVEEEAAALREVAAGWPALVDALRAEVRAGRRAQLRVGVRRARVNRRLDAVCLAFARQLRFEVQDDRKHPRWALFFKVSPSLFTRQLLEEQVRGVRGWLAAQDAALDGFRPELEGLVAEAEAVFAEEAAQAHEAQKLRQRRDEVAARLTAERDALHRRLADRGAELELDRSWADGFFLRG